MEESDRHRPLASRECGFERAAEAQPVEPARRRCVVIGGYISTQEGYVTSTTQPTSRVKLQNWGGWI
jgi:hypothetical protein